jgi:hypothetical protein
LQYQLALQKNQQKDDFLLTEGSVCSGLSGTNAIFISINL